MTEPTEDSIDRTALRRNIRGLVLVIVGLVLAGVAVGVVAGVLAGGDRQEHAHRPSSAGVVLLIVLLMVSLGVVAVVLRFMLRRPSYRRVMQFGWAQRRAVYKAVKAGRPLTRRETQVAAAQLEYLDKNRWLSWYPLVPAAILLLNALTGHGPLRWVMLVATAVCIPLVPFSIVQSRRNLGRYRQAVLGSQPPQPTA